VCLEDGISCYKGSWAHGKAHGFGTYCSPSKTYEGNWENDRRNGFGKATCSTSIYEGQFINDKEHGQGRRRTFTNSVVLEGKYLNGKKNGLHTRTTLNGRVTVIEYEDGRQKNATKISDGGRLVRNSTAALLLDLVESRDLQEKIIKATASKSKKSKKNKKSRLEAAKLMEACECVICSDNPKTHACVPCGHQVLCGNHNEDLIGKPCPICRVYVVTIIQIFK